MLEGENYQLEINDSQNKIKATVKKDSIALKAKASYSSGWLSLQLQNNDKSNYAQLNAKISNKNHIAGKATSFLGNRVDWMAHFNADLASKKKKSKPKNYPAPVAVTFPNNGFGFAEQPSAQNIIFKNATVWTNEEEGILNTDVFEKGKIKAIGNQPSLKSARN